MTTSCGKKTEAPTVREVVSDNTAILKAVSSWGQATLQMHSQFGSGTCIQDYTWEETGYPAVGISSPIILRGEARVGDIVRLVREVGTFHMKNGEVVDRVLHVYAEKVPPPSPKKVEEPAVVPAVKDDSISLDDKVVSDVMTSRELDTMYVRIHSFTPDGKVLLADEGQGDKPFTNEEVKQILQASATPILVLEGPGKVGDGVTLVIYTETKKTASGKVSVVHPVYYGVKASPYVPSGCEK